MSAAADCALCRRAPKLPDRPLPLCGDCAAFLATWDAWGLEAFDYTSLRLFGLSKVWRAAISRQAIHAKVKLGPYEEPFRAQLAQRQPGAFDWMPMVLVASAPAPAAPGVPSPGRFLGVRVYRVPLGAGALLVKVDQQACEDLVDAAIRPDRPLAPLPEDFEKTVELRLIKRIAQRHPLGEKP